MKEEWAFVEFYFSKIEKKLKKLKNHRFSALKSTILHIFKLKMQ